jgi:hypothetical protein
MVRTVTPRGQTHLLQATPCLVSEEWLGSSLGSTIRDSYSSRADSFSPGYTLSEEWPRVGSSLGSAIRDSYSSRADSFSPGYTLFGVRRNGPGWGIVQDSHSLGQTHSLQVTPCLVSEEWPRVRNGPSISRGQTHSLQVTLCLVSEEWPRVGNGPGS